MEERIKTYEQGTGVLIDEAHFELYRDGADVFYRDLLTNEVRPATQEEIDSFETWENQEPPHSTHISILENVDPSKARPAKIKRVWEGRDFHYDCFVTQTVKDQYMAGDVNVGDYVIVHFDNIGEQIVMARIFKSW